MAGKARTITIKEDSTNTSREIGLTRNIQDLIRYVCREFGLYADGFQLRRLRGNKLYPKFLDHMFEPFFWSSELSDIIAGDIFYVQHIQEPDVSVRLGKEAYKTVQTEEITNDDPWIKVYVNVVEYLDDDYDDEEDEVDYDNVNDFDNDDADDDEDDGYEINYDVDDDDAASYGLYDIYVRLHDRIVDLTLEYIRHSDVETNQDLSNIKWIFADKTFKGNDTSVLADVGIKDNTVISCAVEGFDEGGLTDKVSVRTRSIGVQTVAKPAVHYPPVQPPPPVNDPPPSKT